MRDPVNAAAIIGGIVIVMLLAVMLVLFVAVILLILIRKRGKYTVTPEEVEGTNGELSRASSMKEKPEFSEQEESVHTETETKLSEFEGSIHTETSVEKQEQNGSSVNTGTGQMNEYL